MAVASVFEAVISAIDNSSGPLRAIMQAFSGMAGEAEHAGHAAAHAGHEIQGAAHGAAHGLEAAGHAAEHAGHQIGHAAHHRAAYAGLSEHVTLLREHFGELGMTVREGTESLSEFLPALGAIGAVGSAIGLVELVEHVTEAQSELQKTAKMIGISANELQVFNFAAQQTDVSAESADHALVKLNRSIADAASGKSKDAAKLFGHLGIGLKDSEGHLKNVSDLLPQLADAFERTASPAQRTQMAMQLFGRSGTELLPLLLEGSKGLREFAEQSERLQYSFTAEDRKNMEGYHRSIMQLGDAVSGFTNEVGAKLAPVLKPIVDTFTNWVAANRGWIATGIAEAVKSFGDTLTEALPEVHGLVEATKSWVHTIGDVVESLGGFKAAFTGLALVIGAPFLSAAFEVGKALHANIIGPALEAPRALLSFGQALYATRDAEFAMQFAFATNPFGVVLAGAVALGAAAYELYQHWDYVKGEFAKLFDWWSHQDAWVHTMGLIVAPLIAMPLTIVQNWQPLKEFFVALWHQIGAAFAAGWAAIKPIVDLVTAAARDISGLAHMLPAGGGGAHRGMQPDSTGAIDEYGRPVYRGRPLSHPDIPSLSLPPPSGAIPQVIAPLSDRAGADQTVHVRIDVKGLPSGSSVQARTNSPTLVPHVNTGQNLPDGDAAMALGMGAM